MAQKRDNRKRRRRHRFGALYKLLSAVLIVAAIGAGCVVFFRVGEIRVEGNARYTDEEIIGAAELQEGDNLFLINKYQAARRIWTKLPYVDEVAIRRVLPDGIDLSVTECTPAAVIAYEDAWWRLDAKGKLLEGGDETLAQGLATVTGITPILPSAGTKLAVGSENSGKLADLTELLAALETRGMLADVESVDLSGETTLTLGYQGRFTVELNLDSDFDREIRRLGEVVALLESNESGYLDLTGEKGYFRPD